MNSSSPSTQGNHPSTQRQSWLAFIFAVPIAVLGGLIGLGGAEFRLPVLVRVLGYGAKEAVPLNLTVSLITVITSLLVRNRNLSTVQFEPYYPAVASIIAGAGIAAFIGVSIARKISAEQFEKIIVLLLVGIGVALIVEGFLPNQVEALLPGKLVVHMVAGFIFGLMIGLVSSLLGVAGGELIIPTLIFAYGVNIKLAGTLSLMISLPTVLIGILRYRRSGALNDRRALSSTVVPMGVGSIIGAFAGGLMVGITPIWLLKIGLGSILIISAVRMFRHRKDN